VYFLTSDEKRYLSKSLFPRAREMVIAEELRGWSWNEAPLAPVFDVRLGVYEVAGRYCPTARDVYLRRVLGVRVPPSPAMLEGRILHQTLSEIFLKAKRRIYADGLDDPAGLIDRLKQDLVLGPYPWGDDAPGDPLIRERIERRRAALAAFEAPRILARIYEVLALQPYVGPDGLVAAALPIVVEQKFDGSALGLSAHLSCDGLSHAEPIVLDVKFDEWRDFHRLYPTGYALAMEATFEYPVNVGCVVYGRWQGERLLIERDLFLIDEALRQRFIEERDEKARLVFEEIDPGVPPSSPPDCPYYDICH